MIINIVIIWPIWISFLRCHRLSGFLLCVPLLWSSIVTPVGAWEVGLESGKLNSFLANPKYFTSSKYSAVTLRHKYVELIQGGWVGESAGRFIGLSGAYRSSGRTLFDGSFGVVRLLNYQGNQLDGNKQFNFSLGIGRRFDDLSVMVKFRHSSNGSKFLNGNNGKNRGMDFKMIYLGYSF